MTYVDENVFFREATLLIIRPLGLAQVLGDTYEYLRSYLPVQAMALLSYEPARGAACALASVSERAGVRGADEAHPVLSLEPHALERLRGQGFGVHQARPVLVCNRPATDPIYQAAARFFAVQGLERFSLLMVRLDTQADHQGVLWLAASGHDAYVDRHARLARILAAPFAIALSNARRQREIVRLSRRLDQDDQATQREPGSVSGRQVIGAESGLREVMKLVARVAPLNVPVLIQGETGAGKEVIAQAIHRASRCSGHPLVRVQCGALPENLLDSELFGHEKGAFTGAARMRRGRFERADGGTIFFDEIGELSLEAQSKLLRVLDDHTFERVGGMHTLHVDVRVIAATNRDLPAAVERGEFRNDLWFRLNVFPIHLPPLRHRRDDIPALVEYFLDRKTREMGLAHAPILGDGAMEQLVAYGWPGNVRELQNVIERALIICRGRELEFPHLYEVAAGRRSAGARSGIASGATLDEIVADHIRRVLERTRGRVQGPDGAAAVLGVHPSTLRARMRKLGVPFGRSAQADALDPVDPGTDPGDGP